MQESPAQKRSSCPGLWRGPELSHQADVSVRSAAVLGTMTPTWSQAQLQQEALNAPDMGHLWLPGTCPRRCGGGRWLRCRASTARLTKWPRIATALHQSNPDGYETPTPWQRLQRKRTGRGSCWLPASPQHNLLCHLQAPLPVCSQTQRTSPAQLAPTSQPRVPEEPARDGGSPW